LFTDGVPSAVATYPNQNIGGKSVIGSGGFAYPVDTAGTATHPIYGAVVVTGAPPYTSTAGTQIWALYQLASMDLVNNPIWYMPHPGQEPAVSVLATGQPFNPPVPCSP